MWFKIERMPVTPGIYRFTMQFPQRISLSLAQGQLASISSSLSNYFTTTQFTFGGFYRTSVDPDGNVTKPEFLPENYLFGTNFEAMYLAQDSFPAPVWFSPGALSLYTPDNKQASEIGGYFYLSSNLGAPELPLVFDQNGNISEPVAQRNYPEFAIAVKNLGMLLAKTLEHFGFNPLPGDVIGVSSTVSISTSEALQKLGKSLRQQQKQEEGGSLLRLFLYGTGIYVGYRILKSILGGKDK